MAIGGRRLTRLDPEKQQLPCYDFACLFAGTAELDTGDLTFNVQTWSAGLIGVATRRPCPLGVDNDI